MFSSLLRPKKGRQRVTYSPSSSPFGDQSSPLIARQQRAGPRRTTADFTETDAEDSNTEEEDGQEVGEEEPQEEEDNGHEAEDEDGDVDSHILPIFSAAHLGKKSHSLCPRNN
jgi:hypothetical protein